VAEVYEADADIYRRPVGFDPAVHDVPESAGVESTAECRALLAAAVDTMKSLPPVQQAVLAYHFYEGVPLEDIAAGLGIAMDEVTAAYESGVLAVFRTLRRAARNE